MRSPLLPVVALIALPALAPAQVPTRSPSPPRAPALLAEAMLHVHNAARAAVGAPPLAWDATLATNAQVYADTLARGGAFRHDPALSASDDQGENLWRGDAGGYTYEAMADAWAAERRFFINRAFPAVSTTGRWQDVGHYTQMVWKRTARIGCAIGTGAADEFLVCRYAEPGNWDGETAY